jgi:hypothetical protein
MTIEKLPLVFNVAFGSCGNYYFHSLLDSHKQILILPPFQSFYRSWNIIVGGQAVDPDDMFCRWQNYLINSDKMSGNMGDGGHIFTKSQK